MPGSAAFAEPYTKRFGPIANYIERAANPKGGLPTRTDVMSALRNVRYQGIAYARPVESDSKDDNVAAVIFLNTVEGDRFKEVGEITRGDTMN